MMETVCGRCHNFRCRCYAVQQKDSAEQCLIKLRELLGERGAQVVHQLSEAKFSQKLGACGIAMLRSQMTRAFEEQRALLKEERALLDELFQLRLASPDSLSATRDLVEEYLKLTNYLF